MPHLRRRHLQTYLKQCLGHSPIVGVVGHRQVGKTTLISQLAQLYYSLDDEESIAYLTSASDFIRGVSGPSLVAIDEAQLLPELFPALKEHVRKRKRPGQFLLSGSVRFTSLKSIRESLTGRIINLELLPLSINELLELEPPEWLTRIHLKSQFSQHDATLPPPLCSDRALEAQMTAFQNLGGLPGLCFIRNDRIRTSKTKTQLDTILDRDLREIISTRFSLHDLREICSQIANLSGSPMHLADIKLGRRINSVSMRELLQALESLFLIRTLPVLGDQKGTSYFFEDFLEFNSLRTDAITPHEKDELSLFHFVRSAFAVCPQLDYQLFQYSTRGGAWIPLAVRTQERITGFRVIQDQKPNRIERASSKSFLAKYPQSKVIYLSRKIKEASYIDERNLLVPLSAVFR